MAVGALKDGSNVASFPNGGTRMPSEEGKPNTEFQTVESIVSKASSEELYHQRFCLTQSPEGWHPKRSLLILKRLLDSSNISRLPRASNKTLNFEGENLAF